jgi:hypothetical protein
MFRIIDPAHHLLNNDRSNSSVGGKLWAAKFGSTYILEVQVRAKTITFYNFFTYFFLFSFEDGQNVRSVFRIFKRQSAQAFELIR